MICFKKSKFMSCYVIFFCKKGQIIDKKLMIYSLIK